MALRIERWWPHLSIDAKHVLEHDLAAPLPELVRHEVWQITGEELAEGRRLDDAEVQFIRTQKERVD